MRSALERPVHLILAVAVLLAGLSAVAPAAEFRAGQDVVIAAGERIADDVYATGETVTLNGRIEGDLIASGRELRVNGEVTGDLIAAGQAVIVDGRVGDDVRIAGMSLKLGPSASIGDDVVAAGFSFEAVDSSRVGGSLLFSGFQALLAGDVEEGVLGSMSSLEIRGRVGGDSEVEVSGDSGMFPFVQYMPSPLPLPTVPGGLTIGDAARIDGRFEYTSPTAAAGSGVGSGALVRAERPAGEESAAAVERKSPWPGRILRWVGLALLGLLLAWRAPSWLEGRSTEIAARPLLSGGVGFLGLAALPVGALLLLLVAGLLAAFLGLAKLGNLAALAVVGGLVGLCGVFLLFWLTASYLAPLVVGLCTGRWLVGRLAAERAHGLAVPLLAGLAVLAVLRFVPILGTLVGLAIVLLGWGAVILWWWKRPAASS